MNEDRVAGTARNLAGQAQEGFGRATGDVKNSVEGRFRQAAGAAQNLYGQASDAAGDLYGQARDAAEDAARAVQYRAAPLEESIRRAIEERPFTSLAIALAIGWFVGRIGRAGS
jgi:uncharacterized protein YjbJ (UPF0337 family)